MHVNNLRANFEKDKLIFMNKDNNQTNKTILNVGFCETNSEWLDRVINELADESTNKMNFDIICS